MGLEGNPTAWTVLERMTQMGIVTERATEWGNQYQFIHGKYFRDVSDLEEHAISEANKVKKADERHNALLESKDAIEGIKTQVDEIKPVLNTQQKTLKWQRVWNVAVSIITICVAIAVLLYGNGILVPKSTINQNEQIDKYRKQHERINDLERKIEKLMIQSAINDSSNFTPPTDTAQ